MRFVCEWCHESVAIVDKQEPYAEVLAHFTSCSRRAPVTTEQQVAGLSAHITNIICEREREEERIRQAG